MERSHTFSLVGILFTMIICYNLFLLSADVQEECLDIFGTEWSDSEDSTEENDVNQGTEVQITWQDNKSFIGDCPFQDYNEDDMDDDAENAQGLNCDYDCRLNKFSVVGRCSQKNVCQCCGFGGNGCNLENGIWYKNPNYKESNEPCDDLVCDGDCIEGNGAVVGACSGDGSCECCNFP